MKTYKQFKKIIDSRPAFNNPKDDKVKSMDSKEIQQAIDSTIYGGDIKSLKQRMQNADKRNKRQKKIDRLQSTGEWSGLENYQK